VSGALFCEPADPQAKGVVERLHDFLERSFERWRAFANELDFQHPCFLQYRATDARETAPGPNRRRRLVPTGRSDHAPVEVELAVRT
jgi:hypothetical protein